MVEIFFKYYFKDIILLSLNISLLNQITILLYANKALWPNL
jgi:hypothetical protein